MRLRAPLLLALVALAAPAAAPAPSPAATKPAAKAVTKTVKAGGVRIAYRVVGRGKPVLLVQGLSGTVDAWDPKWVDALAAQGRRVVLLANEGIGGSELRPGTLTVRRMGDNAAALIRKLRLGRPDVVGWSMGGTIAQSLAVRHPKRVRRLVLMATAPGDGTATLPTGRAAQALAERQGVAARLDLLFPPVAAAAKERYVRNLALRRGFVPTGPPAVIRAQAAATGVWLLGRDPAGKRVRKLPHRALIGGGALDELLPVANQRRLAKIIPRSKLVVFRDAAHGFFLQKRTTFLARIDRFLG